jgi:TonB-linked SusC/RagA family outer membrane protein
MRHAFSLAALLLAGAVGSALAQERAITGTVRDSITGAPLSSVVVTIRGTRVSVETGDNGTYLLPKVNGAVTLSFRGIGYKRRNVLVTADQNEVDVGLERDVFRLEEIVVTGQATGVVRRNVANAVATIDATDLGAVPTVSIEQQLAGKVAGADIQSNSGAPGGGVQVRLRGITSVNADAEPLYVVDGVIVSDVAIPSNQNEVTAASGGSNPALTQDAQVNRIADLDPRDIASVEILKGASASAIYGGRASNGVVIITTRRGAATAPRFTYTQRFGFSELRHEFGSRHFKDTTELNAVCGPGCAASVGWTPGRFVDLERELAGRKELAVESNVSVSGGSEASRYYASGALQNDPGIIPNTGFQRQNLRLNLDQRVTQQVQASLTSDFIHTNAGRGLTNNDNTTTSFYMVLPFTPAVVDLGRRPDGTFPSNPFAGSNPIQTANLMKNAEDVYRFIGSGQVRWSFASNLRAIFTGGLDYFTQKNSLYFPPELQFSNDNGLPGTSLLSNSVSMNLNLDGSLVHTYAPAGGAFTATTSAGFQYARRSLDIDRVTSRNLIAGQSNIDAGTSVRVRENQSLIRNAGYYLQEEFLTMQERVLLTLGIRADQSSLDADPNRLFYYPKAAVSYRWPQGVGFADELKLRFAYGESGNEPLYGQKFTPLDATNNIRGLPGLVTGGTTGASDLRPERQREYEAGVDGTLLHSRASLEFTVYQKNISDLLLQRSLAPSSGFATEIFNGGTMRTRGVEIALTVIPVQSTAAQWYLRTTFASTRSVITSLPVPAFLTGGFGTSLGAFRIEQGASATQIVGNDTLADGSITVRKLGDATPNFRMSFNSDLTVSRFSLHALLDWQNGSSIINLTKLLYDFGQVTPDYANPVTPRTPADTVYKTVGARRLAGFAKTAANYIESASFLKLRELTLTYDIPTVVAQRLWGGIRDASVSVSVRNLFTIAPYSGLDPEVSNFGNQPVARNIDVAPFPPSRSFWFAINLGF